MTSRVLALIPARAGSKGLPGKNVRPFAGLPLLAHTLQCAALCLDLTRTVVTTDGEAVAEVARRYGAPAPFLRPPELAGDTVPMWPVLQHALGALEAEEGRPYDQVVLLDPTSPTRLPEDVARVVRALEEDPGAEVAVTVSEPHFSPFWHLMTRGTGGYGEPLMPGGQAITRRQQCPPAYFINGLAYAFRAELVRTGSGWMDARCVLVEVPATRAASIDTLAEFQWAESLVLAGLIKLPWLEVPHAQ